MKVCPNCDESFGDDLNFCDVDGTRLERHRDVASTEGRSRAWSLLGAGLLIGALAISAASIIFFPKTRVAPSIASSLPSTGTTPGQNSGEASTSSPATQQPEIVVEEAFAEEAPPAEPKKKEKLADLANANANVPVPNPKAVALEPEDPANSPKRASEPAALTPVEIRNPDPPSAKPAVESRELEKEMKPAPTVDPKKDAKGKGKDSAKDDKKKKDDAKEKKKGGFFGVFKKIFGKD
jgi:hypothetical protein